MDTTTTTSSSSSSSYFFSPFFSLSKIHTSIHQYNVYYKRIKYCILSNPKNWPCLCVALEVSILSFEEEVSGLVSLSLSLSLFWAEVVVVRIIWFEKGDDSFVNDVCFLVDAHVECDEVVSHFRSHRVE